jgi:hypothetical protein
MKICWGYKNVPELAGLSRSERRKVVRACFFEFAPGLWQWWVASLSIPVFGSLGGLAGIIIEDIFGLPDAVYYVSGFIGLMIGSLIYCLIYYGVLVDKFRQFFRDYIAKRKSPI